MNERAHLVGFDFGTTTSSCVLGSAALSKNAVNGRMEFLDYRIEYQPEICFTPVRGDGIDIETLRLLIARWVREIRKHSSSQLHGGAIVTGLTAKKANADKIRSLLKTELGDVICATIEDPRLESWVSFMGSAKELSLNHPNETFLNFDIGGGTTNLAFGRNGEVSDTASLFIGARHVEVDPQTRQVIRRSAYVDPASGPSAIVAAWIRILETIVLSRPGALPRDLTQAAFLNPIPKATAITFSGGVGELVYALAAKSLRLEPYAFGDLGGELAQAIVDSPVLSRDIARYIPESRGRATVIGLALHNQELSGISVFKSPNLSLPLPQIAIAGTITASLSDTELAARVRAALQLQEGVCLFVDPLPESQSELKVFATRLAHLIESHRAPLVLLIKANVGKTFGNLLSRWGTSSVPLLVLDEVDPGKGQFVHIGVPIQGVVPIAFYGMG